MIKTVVKYYNEDDFEFTWHPIEDTLSIKKTQDGYEARYLIQDEIVNTPDEWGDDNLFLVNYHRDFHVTNDKIIVEDEVREIYVEGKTEEGEIEKKYFIFPLSCLVHSGVWLSLAYSFTCDPGGWDTSHVGLVLVSKEEAKTKEKARKLAEGLVKTWNMCLSGDVYCLVKEIYDKDKKPIDFDTLGGAYGRECALEALRTEI